MLTAILAILSSTGVGSIIGLLGGIANRWIDLKNKDRDYAFELQKMDKEREYLKDEIAGKVEVATIEGEAKIESSAYDALQASYSFAQTDRRDGWVDKFSKAVRPFLTLAFFFLSMYVFYEIHTLLKNAGEALDVAEVMKLYKYAIEWIFFQAGVSIGWWFAMRPGKLFNTKER
jgi:hypothetical protein